ncbi:unnamed protein product [Oikopleura dioica]|uniref:Uncharacterized protein n=1 Tax=Oikopleura dioica TaxID=34765 RepID=E4X729_OIKDI|nr:unnamed protein product [Oikopleura dioica]
MEQTGRLGTRTRHQRWQCRYYARPQSRRTIRYYLTSHCFPLLRGKLHSLRWRS